MFGYENDMFLTYLFLMLKYYIYLCKFQSKIPNFQGFRTYIDYNKDLEYRIAKEKNKLPLHFKKWKFVLLMLFYNVVSVHVHVIVCILV